MADKVKKYQRSKLRQIAWYRSSWNVIYQHWWPQGHKFQYGRIFWLYTLTKTAWMHHLPNTEKAEKFCFSAVSAFKSVAPPPRRHGVPTQPGVHCHNTASRWETQLPSASTNKTLSCCWVAPTATDMHWIETPLVQQNQTNKERLRLNES